VTDPDARKLRSSFHALTGYNAQAVVAEGQIVIAAEVTGGDAFRESLVADDRVSD
jgi:hypothetical protein